MWCYCEALTPPLRLTSTVAHVSSFARNGHQMPRVNRSEIIATDEVQVFHLVNRCVRRTFLCGNDPQTGRDYSHRKLWIRRRLEQLAAIFGMDILGYGVMSNHLHVVVRTRPDLVRKWTDQQVALRWWTLFPQRKNADGSAAKPTKQELYAILKDQSALKERRLRLSDISWFMRCLAEPVARRGNREDDVTGRFWEGRFKAHPVLDEPALAACMAYVDLNPIRAGIAKTPESSEFTSICDRIHDQRKAAQKRSKQAAAIQTEHGERAGWLAPVPLQPTHKTSRQKPTVRRAGNKGCLPMSLEQYKRLLEWTGKQLRKLQTDEIPSEAAAILKRLQINPESWLPMVQRFRKHFRFAAGLPQSQQRFREERKRRRIASGVS